MTKRRRSLILAGGGLKVAYQAGCLQVLLDEAGLEFDHVDAASGGCFNLAMLASGLSGTEIANAWRTTPPLDLVTLNGRELRKLSHARSIGTLEGLRTKVLPAWGVDWNRIRGCESPVATFNVFNFSRKRLEVIPGSAMTEAHLLAAVSLPMWFPPVEIHGDTYVDAVFHTDANLGEAVRRGADEMWCIWTVADRPDYRDGFLAQYFHIVETTACGRFLEKWNEIDTVNRAIDAHGADTSRATPDLELIETGAPGGELPAPPPGRKRIEQHLIKQDVPVHYLLNGSRDRLREVVEMGVRDARDYCRERGLLGKGKTRAATLPPTARPVHVEFSETLRGSYAPVGGDSLAEARRLSARLAIHIDDLDEFLWNPDHEARVTGTIDGDGLGVGLPITDGRLQILVIEDRGSVDDPAIRQMRYQLTFRSEAGTRYLLEGQKQLRNDPGRDAWSDLTTLHTQLFAVNGTRLLLGRGALRVGALDVLRQLATFRVRGARPPIGSLQALARFGKFFTGRSLDVYGRRWIDHAPL